MSTRFFTNLDEHTLFKKFQGVFESNADIERFDALVGYLRSSGYFALRPYPLQQASEAPVSGAARPLDTTPDIILSESFDNLGS